jgi:hypothetical protein
MKSKYEIQAERFLISTDTKFSAKFLKYDVHFDNDTDKRDIYEITLTRGNRKYVFNFGQYVNSSGRFWKYGRYESGCEWGRLHKGVYVKPSSIGTGETDAWKKNPDFKEPTPYAVLACLQKYDPGTFENFCSDFGYDTDSRRAEKIYKAVQNEWTSINLLFSDSEIEQLQEIG